MHERASPNFAGPTRPWRRGLLLLCLLPFLPACAGLPPPPETVVVRPPPERVAVRPPPALLGDCSKPQFAGSTNADVLAYAEELASAIDACNTDKAALRKWSESAK